MSPEREGGKVHEGPGLEDQLRDTSAHHIYYVDSLQINVYVLNFELIDDENVNRANESLPVDFNLPLLARRRRTTVGEKTKISLVLEMLKIFLSTYFTFLLLIDDSLQRFSS